MNKAERLTQELTYLNNHHHFHLQDLEDEFSISKRTTLRDLNALEKMGLAFYSTHGKYGGYQIINHGPLIPVTFALSEIAAIFFAIDALQILSNNPFQQSYPRIARRLFDTLPEEQQEQIKKQRSAVQYYNVPIIHQSLNLNSLLTAIINRQEVSFNSLQLKTKVKAQLLSLLYRNGNWFINGISLDTHTNFRLRCDLLTNFIIKKQTAPYSLHQLAVLYRKGHSQVTKIHFTCQVTKSGQEHFFKNHYPHMTINDQLLTGYYTDQEAKYMVDYLLSFGSQLIILSPARLKKEYCHRLKQMLAHYC